MQAQILPTVNPKVKAIVDGISEQRISATLQHLETFGTRHLSSSDTDPQHGIGAARRWLADQLRGFSPRLQVSFDTYHIKKHGRIVRDTDVVNVVAVLPGTVHPERQVVISAHYDSLVIVKKAGTAQAPAEGEATASADWEKSAEATFAPGISDDGSGVAAVLEAAQVMSQQEFRNTVVFVLFAGEEEGLIGSTLLANKAKAEGRKIDAVLNNDIIGSDVSGDGRRANRVVNVYSGDPNDSPSRTLARYVKQIGERYMPSMQVNLIFRADRFSRGGDHTPFDQAGFAAVRFTTPTENFANQHTVTDTFANTSPSYTALVTKVNAAALASLALAPAAPGVLREITTGDYKGRVAPRISRGKSGYDAALKWVAGVEDADVAGYEIVSRSTLAPLWEKRTYVGKVLEYTLPDVSIDELVFGVRAVDKDGNESLVAPYVMVTRPLEKIETY